MLWRPSPPSPQTPHSNFSRKRWVKNSHPDKTPRKMKHFPRMISMSIMLEISLSIIFCVGFFPAPAGGVHAQLGTNTEAILFLVFLKLWAENEGEKTGQLKVKYWAKSCAILQNSSCYWFLCRISTYTILVASLCRDRGADWSGLMIFRHFCQNKNIFDPKYLF